MSLLSRKLFISALYLSLLSSTTLWAMDEEREKNTDSSHHKIKPIDIEQCEEWAEGIRKADEEGDQVVLAWERRGNADIYLYYLDLALPTREVGKKITTYPQYLNLATSGSKKKKVPKIPKKEKFTKHLEGLIGNRATEIISYERCIKTEKRIYKSALRALSGYNTRERYEELVSQGKLSPSQAILKLTEDIEAQPKALELLELIEDYDEYDSRLWLNQDVGIDASLRIFNYYLKKYNERVKTLLNINQMDEKAHELLHLCQLHTPMHPMTGIDDPECSLMHIAGFINQQLVDLRLWYLKNPPVVRALPSYLLLKSMALGVRLLECTTYGMFPKIFDLAYLLQLKGFKGVKTPCYKNNTEFQHIWVHSYLPLQVRINQNGKLTVGFVKKIPFQEDEQIEKRLLNGRDNEIYKISNPNLINYVIPAQQKGKEIQKLWLKETKQKKKKELMAEAHRRLYLGDMNFDEVSGIINPEEATHTKYFDKADHDKKPKDKKKDKKKKKSKK